MEQSFRNFKPFSSNRKIQAIFASPNKYFTENSRQLPLLRYYCGILRQTLCEDNDIAVILSLGVIYCFVMFCHIGVQQFLSSALAPSSQNNVRCYFDIPVRPTAKILTSLLVIIGSVMPQKNTMWPSFKQSHVYFSSTLLSSV